MPSTSVLQSCQELQGPCYNFIKLFLLKADIVDSALTAARAVSRCQPTLKHEDFLDSTQCLQKLFTQTVETALKEEFTCLSSSNHSFVTTGALLSGEGTLKAGALLGWVSAGVCLKRILPYFRVTPCPPDNTSSACGMCFSPRLESGCALCV